jgi:anti-anti-sigma factor
MVGRPHDPPEPIEIAAHSPALAIVTLRGEHDLGSWSEITLALANASECPGVLVDLSECTFLDSSMLTALLVTAKQLRLRGGALEVVIPTGTQVRRIFEVMNVQTLLALHESRDAGIAAIVAGQGHEPVEPAEAA